MSLNPIQFSKDVVDQYGRYLKTTFPIAHDGIREQVHSRLTHGVGGIRYLSKGPYVHLNRPFEKGPTIEELLNESELGLSRGIKSVFPFERLHKHQELAVRSILKEQHTIISSGTGSGKTESFLIPIVNHCLKLQEEEKDPGVVAILVYPMNALVNDQLKRLRASLAGTRITFGRYTGETPESNISVKKMKSPTQYTPAQKEQLKKNPDTVPLPWEECFSKEEIRDRKPNILLTNYKQLEYLLLRDKDIELFKGKHVKYLVFDEVHTYTGILGSETACLIRRVKEVTGNRENIICIGTSATVAREQGKLTVEQIVKPFAQRLFGVEEGSISIVSERFADTKAISEVSYFPTPKRSPKELMDEILVASREVQLQDEAGELPKRLLELTEELCGCPSLASGTINNKMYELLRENKFVSIMISTFTKPTIFEDSLKRFKVLKGQENMSDDEIAAQIVSYLTLGALVSKDEEPLLRPKLHYFVQGLQGLWVTPNKNTWKVVFEENTEDIDNVILPLTLCRSCGQHYFHVYSEDPAQAVEIEGKGNSFRKIRPSERTPPPPGEVEFYLTDKLVSDDESTTAESKEHFFMCEKCGALHTEKPTACLNEICGKSDGFKLVYGWMGDLTKCRACGNTKVGQMSIVRPVRSGAVSDITILAQTMLSTMTEEEFRKLLIFTDNRQDAAYQAAWMEERSKRFRLRHLLVNVLHKNKDKVWHFKSLVDELTQLAMEQGILPKGQYRIEENAKKITWFIDEEFATSQQRRSSLENLGLAKVHYEGLNDLVKDDFVTTWAKALKVNNEQLIDIISIILDYYRRRSILNEPFLKRHWTSNDKEIFQNLISVPEHFYPTVLVPESVSGDFSSKYRKVWDSQKGQSAAQHILGKAIQKGETTGFLEALWNWLIANEYLVPSQLVKKGHGKLREIKIPPGAQQINHEKVGFSSGSERFYCKSCRRSQNKALPTNLCPEYRCNGKTTLEALDEDNYDVVQYTKLNFVPLRTYEHSAQVPKEQRESVEREFKRTGGEYNCLVATPTLELGVDIGQLELVLLRNAPPTPANYSQRAGRAGRRHRIAVVFTYCRGTQHDRYFFKNPPEMISGEIRVPSFSMQNVPLLRKHIHSSIFTKMREILSNEEKIQFGKDLPEYISGYLGEYKEFEGGERFQQFSSPPQIEHLQSLIKTHKEPLLSTLISTYQKQWPADGSDIVSTENLNEHLDMMPAVLNTHVTRLFNHFNTYTRIISQFYEIQKKKLELSEDEKRQRNKFEKARKWFLNKENRETYTLTYLSDDGFLPGYALGRDSCLAQCFDPFIELARAPPIALREYTPANWIYAHKNIFRVLKLNFYKFSQEASDIDDLSIGIGYNRTNKRIFDISSLEMEGGEDELDRLNSFELTEIELKKLQNIDDRSDARRYVGFEIQGLLMSEHKGGYGGSVVNRNFNFFRGRHLRIVNIGTKKNVGKGLFGFPICPGCGETRDPHASEVEISSFNEYHKKLCKNDGIKWATLHVDFVSDVLEIYPFEEHSEAVNVKEAIRIGAKEVLDMTNSDIDGFIAIDENNRHSAVIYDPMPGGSGFLPQIIDYWPLIIDKAYNTLDKCDCEKACYSCLLHFRNQQYHEELDRQKAMNLLLELKGKFKEEYPIPPKFADKPLDTDDTDSPAEVEFKEILTRRSFPLPDEDHKYIDLGNGEGMEADYYYRKNKVIILIDGLSRGIHGNAERQQKDVRQRAKARMKGYMVVEISARGLSDDVIIKNKLDEIAMYIEHKEE